MKGYEYVYRYAIVALFFVGMYMSVHTYLCMHWLMSFGRTLGCIFLPTVTHLFHSDSSFLPFVFYVKHEKEESILEEEKKIQYHSQTMQTVAEEIHSLLLFIAGKEKQKKTRLTIGWPENFQPFF